MSTVAPPTEWGAIVALAWIALLTGFVWFISRFGRRTRRINREIDRTSPANDRQARIVNDEVSAAARAAQRQFSDPARFDADHEARS